MSPIEAAASAIDNTYSNYHEGEPLAVAPNGAAACYAHGEGDVEVTGAGGGAFELRPDLDAIEALSSERDQLWARLDKASFLEKRWAAGYGGSAGGGGGGAGLGAKYNADR